MTVISNLFLDTYLPKASGDAVKVYLLLLRYAGAGQSITLSILAKKLEQTEERVGEALAYWETMGLLHITKDQTNQILSMQLLPIPVNLEKTIDRKKEEKDKDKVEKEKPLCRPISEVIKTSYNEKNASISYMTDKKTPEKKSVSPYELDHHSDSKKINQIFYITERYFEKQLTVTDINILFYIYDSLKFSSELLEYLIEYCVSIDKKSVRYAGQVALGWYKSGITTVEQAKTSTKNYSKTYNAIVKAFGVSGRGLGSVELNYIDTWMNTYGFSLSIILEACNRTLGATYQPSFKYANKILSDWFQAGVTSMEEIAKLDALHQSSRKQMNTKNSVKPMEKVSANNKFHNFEQRTYDYQELEQRFINKANGIPVDYVKEEVTNS